MGYEFGTKKEMLEKLIDYTKNSDDMNIRIKEIIKDSLLKCPELLYALHNVAYEDELFDEDGNLLEDGDWSVYFGDNIRPYVFFPETQTEVKNYLCFKVDYAESPRYNAIEKYIDIVFLIIVNGKDIVDKHTGIPRHDLISSILRDKFSWTNIFGNQCKITENKEGSTDNDYVMRTMAFRMTATNSILKNGKVINYKANV